MSGSAFVCVCILKKNKTRFALKFTQWTKVPWPHAPSFRPTESGREKQHFFFSPCLCCPPMPPLPRTRSMPDLLAAIERASISDHRSAEPDSQRPPAPAMQYSFRDKRLLPVSLLESYKAENANVVLIEKRRRVLQEEEVEEEGDEVRQMIKRTRRTSMLLPSPLLL